MNPTTSACPAPWQLQGHGLIVLLKSATARALADPAIEQAMVPGLRSRFAVLMLVNYQHSNVGPYQELLYIPGSAQFDGRRHLTISNIWVSSQASVDNGRRNWGIPKQLANFSWQTQPDGGQRVRVAHAGQTLIDLRYQGKGWACPVHTALVPGFMRTLVQSLDGQRYVYTPSAKGRCKLASIQQLSTPSALFPAIQTGDVVAAFEASQFQMTFPVAHVQARALLHV
ncbi:MAG TPA: acetoacetate decarboxylase family protein [Limnobacter sp.]|nr:acetoacetate decarboxylase family protein [Limnobacter sp.]